MKEKELVLTFTNDKVDHRFNIVKFDYISYETYIATVPLVTRLEFNYLIRTDVNFSAINLDNIESVYIVYDSGETSNVIGKADIYDLRIYQEYTLDLRSRKLQKC